MVKIMNFNDEELFLILISLGELMIRASKNKNTFALNKYNELYDKINSYLHIEGN